MCSLESVLCSWHFILAKHCNVLEMALVTRKQFQGVRKKCGKKDEDVST